MSGSINVTIVRIEAGTQAITPNTDIDQYQVLSRLTAGTGPWTGLDPGDITTEGSPADGDFVLGWIADGSLRKYDIGTISAKVSPPAGPSATGSPGQWAFDGTYFYFCIATDTWARFVGALTWS